MGWLMVMFDLPVMTKRQRKTATGFRLALLDQGYIMVQYSVYARSCTSWDAREAANKRLEAVIPEGGNVRAIFITDKQWQKATTLIGECYMHKRWNPNPKIPEQMEFW